MCGAGVSGVEVTRAGRLVRLTGCSGCFVVGSIRRLTHFAFRSKPVVNVRSRFSPARFVKLIGTGANRIIGDRCHR